MESGARRTARRRLQGRAASIAACPHARVPSCRHARALRTLPAGLQLTNARSDTFQQRSPAGPAAKAPTRKTVSSDPRRPLHSPSRLNVSPAKLQAATVSAISCSSVNAPTLLPDKAEVLLKYGWMLDTPLPEMMERASRLRDAGPDSHFVSFSPKVFLPLTRLCRDSCGYCTFAQPPRPGRRAYMTLEEVLKVAGLGASAGCSEALFTLGDKPEQRWPQAAAELAEMGYRSTLEYVEEAARAVLRETGLLPHINAGVMQEEELRRLKQVSASQGLMLESTSLELLAPGGPHHDCPDKDPAARLGTIEAAGRARVPYTSGILVGIGDTRADRLHALACLHRLHERYGHIQELIIQNFRAKPGTAMASAQEPPLEELLWAVAAARIMFGPDMNIQAPPNLTPLEAGSPGSSAGGTPEDRLGGASPGSLEAGWRALLDAGINDWGGISPLTRDYVNPERPWPHLAPLAAATAAAGKLLLPRLPVYPPYLGLRATRSSGLGLSNPRAGGTSDHVRGTTGASAVPAVPPSSVSRLGVARSEEGGEVGRCLEPVPGPQVAGSAAAAVPAAAAEGPGLSPWLDFSSGRQSVGAAVLASADSEGLLRASSWVAGRPDEDPGPGPVPDPDARLDPSRIHEPGSGSGSGPAAVSELRLSGHEGLTCDSDAGRGEGGGGGWGRVHDPDSSSSGAVSARRRSSSSVPLPRWREGRAWTVEVDVNGAMRGVVVPSEPSRRVVRLLEGVLEGGRPLQQDEVELLLRSRGADHAAVCAAADELRRRTCGDTVSYVVNRNINYTNVCTYKCSFCAFSKGKAAEELRGPAYVVPYDEITRRTAEAWDRGATEVCMQGGIHPDFTGHTYLRILAAAKAGAPRIHVHAFSPLEVHHGATSLGLSYESYLEQLASAGLGSLPGTAAEVLDDQVRRVLCPDKIDTATWLKVVGAAHRVGLRTTSTLMFGSVEAGPAAWAAHLMALRGQQQRAEEGAAAGGGGGGQGAGAARAAGVGFTEFVPLPFVHMEAPVYLKGSARRGPTLHEGVLLHAVSRLALHPHITNIQASWVKMGPSRAGQLLAAGCNDMGGSIMNETITRAAGASHGQELPPARMEAIIRAAGRQPRQRTTLYGSPPADQTARSFGAAPLQPLVMSAPGSGALR